MSCIFYTTTGHHDKIETLFGRERWIDVKDCYIPATKNLNPPRARSIYNPTYNYIRVFNEGGGRGGGGIFSSFLHRASVRCPIDLKFTGELEKVHTFEINKTRGQSEL